MPLASPLLQTTLARPRARSTRQGPRHLRFRRPAADRRHRSDFGVRLRARVGHPRQGQGPHADFRVLVRAHPLDRRQSRAVDRSGVVSRPRRGRCREAAARPIDARHADRAAADRVRRARLSVGLRLEGLPGHRRGLRHPAAGRTCASRIGCRSRSSRRPPRRRAATTSTSAKREAAELVGQRVLERVRDLTLRLYAEGAAHAESRGIIVADTKFEFGLLPVADGRPAVRSRIA